MIEFGQVRKSVAIRKKVKPVAELRLRINVGGWKPDFRTTVHHSLNHQNSAASGMMKGNSSFVHCHITIQVQNYKTQNYTFSSRCQDVCSTSFNCNNLHSKGDYYSAEEHLDYVMSELKF